MTMSRLILTVPQGMIIATSLSTEGYAAHRSPGSGKFFQGRAVFAELATDHGKPAFTFCDEGGWRDATADTRGAMEAAASGKKTKTALSNNGFSVTPIAAYTHMYLVKTGGELLELEPKGPIATFAPAECHENMAPDEIATAIGVQRPIRRVPRLYMTLAPVEMLVLSNLTPAEYVWYATHRPGKMFRQVMFAEISGEPKHLMAESLFTDARAELAGNSTKKTKTLMHGDVLNKILFPSWVGYDREAEGGLYVGDRSAVSVWSFPETIPRAWERAY